MKRLFKLRKRNHGKKREIDTITLRIGIIGGILIASAIVLNFVIKNNEIFILLTGAALGLLLGEFGISYWDRKESRKRHNHLINEIQNLEEQQESNHILNHLSKFKNAVELSHSLYSLMNDLVDNNAFRVRIMIMKCLSNAQALGISDALEKELEYWKSASSKGNNGGLVEEVITSRQMIEEGIRGISEELENVFEIGWWSSYLAELSDPDRKSNILSSDGRVIRRTKDWIDLLERLTRILKEDNFEPHLIVNLVNAFTPWIGNLSNIKPYYLILVSDWYIRRFWVKNEQISKLKELMKNDLEKVDFPQKAYEIITNLEFQYPLDMPARHLIIGRDLLDKSKKAGNL